MEIKHPLSVEFELPSKEGTLDIAIRYDTVDGHYGWCIEEQGLPVTVPQHVLSGILMSVIMASSRSDE